MNQLEKAQKLGKILRTLLHDRDWSALGAAKRAGINPSTFNGYVNGIVFPVSKENQALLAQLLGISLKEFDKMFELATAVPTRPVDELCQDIRLLNAEDFAIVAEVVFNRVVAELKNSSSSPPSKR
jgi:transcriptional regulator with XRE-family HTH domain